jgi:hypothetical protein
MSWSVVPFGKYGGKTLPEIIVRDLDWFFWMLPKLYGKLGTEAHDLARKVRAIRIPKARRYARNFSVMTKTFYPDRTALMSPRTAKYVEAMTREGDNFDYNKWLKRVREEEAQAGQAWAIGTSVGFAPAQIAVPIRTFDDQRPRPNLALLLTAKTTLAQALRRSQRRAKSKTRKARLRRWFERVRGAWGDFQASRARDAVYDYLEAVFAIVTHFRIRRRTKRLLRHAFEFANIPFDKNADPFTAVIRCTCGDGADNKTVSKWSRALRYVARSKGPDSGLREFIKGAGGVNASADRYAKHVGRGK